MTDSPTVAGAGRFEVRVTSDSRFSWVRTRLSLERTMMSWLRTAVALIGFLQQIPGVGPAHGPNAPRYLGLVLISCGVLALVVSIWQYRWTVRYLWGEPFASIAGMTTEGMQSPVIAIAVLIIFIGFFAFAAVLVHLL
jgi:putative membrane protein